MSEGKLARVAPLFAGESAVDQCVGRSLIAMEDLIETPVRLDGWISLDGDENVRQEATIIMVPEQRWSTLDERVVAELGLAPVEGVVEIDVVVFQFDGDPVRLRGLRAWVTPPSPGGGLRLGYSVARLCLSFGAAAGG